jgi:hypothetical protein
MWCGRTFPGVFAMAWFGREAAPVEKLSRVDSTWNMLVATRVELSRLNVVGKT